MILVPFFSANPRTEAKSNKNDAVDSSEENADGDGGGFRVHILRFKMQESYQISGRHFRVSNENALVLRVFSLCTFSRRNM